MKEKIVLATRSNKYIFLMILGILLFAFMATLMVYLYIDTKEDAVIIFMILFSGFLFFFGYEMIITLIKPKNVIERDKYGIYLNYSKKKTIYILVRDINNVRGEEIQSRYKNFSFGKLTIWTKNKKYKIGVVNEVKRVASYIDSRIAYKLFKPK